MRDAKQNVGLIFFFFGCFYLHDANQEEGREVKGMFGSAHVSA